ncbi:hypothetical protein AB833_01555 [Chromatiales bacterium (ex Bugula neritina AB1)]|nr:hypothetical protein AB833_01555 [Chromatiales bacterium (ex Bugula neritina AB1)]
MQHSTIKLMLLASCLTLSLTACTISSWSDLGLDFGKKPAPEAENTEAGDSKPGDSQPAREKIDGSKVKPELDYSKESPDCVTAGQRIADNLQVGMSQKDVLRLVGKPKFRLPGNWWWSFSFDKTGKPIVFFNPLGDVVNPDVVKIVSDTDRC